MLLNAGNLRIHEVYRELGSIVENAGLAARLPQSLLDRLKAMRGMLLEELNNLGEADLERDLHSAELSQGARPIPVPPDFPRQSPEVSSVHS